MQVDLIRTLQRLKCPMIAYDQVVKWAVRSCSRGHSFHNLPISSHKTVVDKVHDCVNYKGLSPILKHLHIPYSNCTFAVVYFNAHAVFNSLLSCPDLNRDENYNFHDPENPAVDPFARPSGLKDFRSVSHAAAGTHDIKGSTHPERYCPLKDSVL